jgi:hypothetical protein
MAVPKLREVKDRYQRWKLKILELTTDKEQEKIYGTGWNRIGYHRPIGDWLFSIGTMILGIPFGLILLPLLKFTEFRFPELKAFEVAAGALFGALYTILDLELQPAVDRFVPQYVVSDPKKSMQYVTFFIKYQMWSGLVQILFVSLFMFLYIIPYTDFAYLTWFILFINIKQYPAILSTFVSVLRSLQVGDKQNLITFFRSSVIEPLTRIGGGLLGLYFGSRNPIWGDMMGMALGFAIGAYLDDFFMFFMGMHWLSKVLDKYGISMMEIYGQKVPAPVWKSALGYSMRLMPKTIFGAFMGLFGFLVTYEGLPGYQSYVGLIGQAENLKKIVGWSDDIINRSQPAFSEAYNNGKLELTRFYIGEGLKYNSFFFAILGGINIFGFPLIVKIIMGVFLTEDWALIAVIAPLQIIVSLHSPYHEVMQKMTYISGHPEINAVLDIIGSIVNLFFTWYFLFVLELGWVALIVARLPWEFATFAIRWIFVHKKVLPLPLSFWKSVAWQCFVAPLIGGAAFIIVLEFILIVIWPIISAPFSGDLLLIPLVPTLLLIGADLLFVFMPITAYMGFFDDRSITIFKRAVSLSGPSLWVVWPMYKILNHFYKKSPFKNKFDQAFGDRAEKELQELSIMRYENTMKFLQE